LYWEGNQTGWEIIQLTIAASSEDYSKFYADAGLTVKMISYEDED
jgi:hypothetical protein